MSKIIILNRFKFKYKQLKFIKYLKNMTQVQPKEIEKFEIKKKDNEYDKIKIIFFN